jgi:hypothetical protein
VNVRHHTPDSFDARLRQLHECALVALPADTLARLRANRHATTPQPHSRRLLLATAASALLAIGIGVQLSPDTTAEAPAALSSTAAAAEDYVSDDTYFDENPDLYVWLASETSLAME